uniref:Uncharacterized protein n=1 Tax=Phakopsora pachyrhizi TaxID=170000 RepID=A0A0S1MIS7_PHAPC
MAISFPHMYSTHCLLLLILKLTVSSAISDHSLIARLTLTASATTDTTIKL